MSADAGRPAARYRARDRRERRHRPAHRTSPAGEYRYRCQEGIPHPGWAAACAIPESSVRSASRGCWSVRANPPQSAPWRPVDQVPAAADPAFRWACRAAGRAAPDTPAACNKAWSGARVTAATTAPPGHRLPRKRKNQTRKRQNALPVSPSHRGPRAGPDLPRPARWPA